MRLRVAALAWLLAHAAHAQDAMRGAQLYMRLPGDVPSCVGCHGPDPTQGRNNIFRAADNAGALLKAVNDVGAMGYLKPILQATDMADLAAYLGRVAAVANPLGPVAVWPPTLDFGALTLASSSPPHRLQLMNRSPSPWQLEPIEVPPGAWWSIVHDCPVQLAPGARCNVFVTGAPDRAGTSTGAIRLAADASWSPFYVGISGLGRAGATGVLTSHPSLTELTFPSQPVGTQQTRSWTMINTASEPFTLGTFNASGPAAGAFAIGGDCTTGRVLAPAQGCTMEVTHRPLGIGASHAVIQLRGNGTHPSPLVLSGEATAPQPSSQPHDAPLGGGGCAGAGPASTRRVDALWLVLLVVAGWRLARARFRPHVTVVSSPVH